MRLAVADTVAMELARANRKIAEQAAALKRLNEDMEQLSYIISHDLKAPARNISSFMKLMAGRYSIMLPPDGQEFIKMSQSGSEKLAKQIDDVVSYCRVDRNLPPAADVDLNEVVKTICMEMKPRLDAANAEIRIERMLPALKDVHSAMIYKVIQNLVDNGIKFNTSANPVVKIDFNEEGDYVTFCVSDNGIGIQKGFESKLFQMFKRLHTADQFEGKGTGLALCKKILAFYNGTIRYESEAGAGTTFYFTLPKQLVGRELPGITEFVSQPVFVSTAA